MADTGPADSSAIGSPQGRLRRERSGGGRRLRWGDDRQWYRRRATRQRRRGGAAGRWSGESAAGSAAREGRRPRARRLHSPQAAPAAHRHAGCRGAAPPGAPACLPLAYPACPIRGAHPGAACCGACKVAAFESGLSGTCVLPASRLSPPSQAFDAAAPARKSSPRHRGNAPGIDGRAAPAVSALDSSRPTQLRTRCCRAGKRPPPAGPKTVCRGRSRCAGRRGHAASLDDPRLLAGGEHAARRGWQSSPRHRPPPRRLPTPRQSRSHRYAWRRRQPRHGRGTVPDRRSRSLSGSGARRPQRAVSICAAAVRLRSPLCSIARTQPWRRHSRMVWMRRCARRRRRSATPGPRSRTGSRTRAAAPGCGGRSLSRWSRMCTSRLR